MKDSVCSVNTLEDTGYVVSRIWMRNRFYMNEEVFITMGLFFQKDIYYQCTTKFTEQTIMQKLIIGIYCGTWEAPIHQRGNSSVRLKNTKPITTYLALHSYTRDERSQKRNDSN